MDSFLIPQTWERIVRERNVYMRAHMLLINQLFAF